MATNNSLIMSSLWANATNSFQQRVPASTVASTAEQFKVIFEPGNQALRNEFIDQLINRVGMSYVRQQSWRNPLRTFVRGRLEYGQSVLEAQAGWVKAHSYQDDIQELLKVHRPEFEQCIHTIDREDQYPISVNHVELRRATVDEYGLNQFVSAVMDSVINSANWDEYVQMRQLIAWYNDNLGFYKIQGAEPTDEATAKAFLKGLKAMVARLQFPSARYNAQTIDSIATFARPDELVLLVTPEAAAAIDVDALAMLFNLDKGDSDVQERRIIVDEFPIPGAYAMLTTQDWFQVYDSVYENGSFYNPQTLTTNYYLTVMQVMSCSPFVPAIIWTTEAGTDTGTITMTTNNSLTTVLATRDQRGNFTEFTGTAPMEVTKDMVDGTNGDVDGVYIFAALNGSLAAGDISGATQIGNVTVRPDGYTVKSLSFDSAGPANVNSRTFIDRNGRLHLQAGAYKSENGTVLTAVLEPVYTNPSGATPTPVESTVTVKVMPNFNQGPVPPTPVEPGPLSQYVSRVTIAKTDGDQRSMFTSGDALDADPILVTDGGTPGGNNNMDFYPNTIRVTAQDGASMTTASTYSMSWTSGGSPRASSTEQFSKMGDTTFEGSLSSLIRTDTPDDETYVSFPISIVTPDGTITKTVRVTYYSGN